MNSSNHIDIFDNIFAIKDKISDNEFLEINNKLQRLIEENNELRRYNNTLIKNGRMPRGMRLILVPRNRENNEDSSESEELVDSDESEELVDSDESEELVDSEALENAVQSDEFEGNNTNICTCGGRYIFTDIMLLPDDGFTNFFCLDTEEKMRNCQNFRKLLDFFPLLENLYNKIDLPFIEEQIEQEYTKSVIVRKMRILLSIIEKQQDRMKKAIVSFVMYDFLIRNIRFMKDNNRFAISCLKKLEELISEEEYRQLAQEYNVNYRIWHEILKSVV